MEQFDDQPDPIEYRSTYSRLLSSLEGLTGRFFPLACPSLSQLRTMLWLRWRLTRSQWRRNGALNAAIMMAVMIIGLGLAAVGAVVGLVAGMLALSDAPPYATTVVFDLLIGAFLFMWMMGLLAELQHSEIVDLSRMLHLPISLRDVFFLNYFASHLSLSMAITLPVMLGLTVGLVLGRGATMLLLFPLVLGFFFMITAWTYCLRNWLAALMVNKRRRRAVVVGFFFGFILLTQIPNLVMQVWLRPGQSPEHQTVEERQQQNAEKHAEMEAVFEVAHRVVPVLWLPNGAGTLVEGRPWPALWGALGMVGFGVWGLARAYHGTVRFYRGVDTGKPTPVVKPSTSKPRTKRRLLVERRLPMIPEEAGALGLATLRSMSRAPEVKMALVMNLVILGFMGFSVFMRRPGPLPFELRPFLASGAVAVTFMGLTQLMFNQFGFDRSGFRALVLLPTPRRHILMGKNLAVAVMAVVVFSLFLVLATAFAHLRFLDVLAAILEFVAAFLLMCVLGNLASILAPYRVSPGSVKPTKTKSTTALLIFVIQMFSLVLIFPVFLPPAIGQLTHYFCGLPLPVATLASAAVLSTLSVLLYWRAMAPLERLLERREQKILEVVTAEVE